MSGRSRSGRWSGRMCTALVLVIAAGVAAGCGARAEYGLSVLRLGRTGWDTLAVESLFSKHTVWDVQFVQPDTAVVRLFDAARDTLYAGPMPGEVRIPIPDATLGDRALMLVEVCGRFGEALVCGQRGVRTSPKRVHVQAEITYPAEGDFSRGRYRLQIAVERKRFGQSGWEPIDPKGPPAGYLLAHVRGRRASALRVPLRGSAGVFRLARLDGWEDFAFSLHSALFDADSTQVAFKVYAARGPAARPASPVWKSVHVKTHSEQRAVVRYVARQAAAQVVHRLADEEDNRRITVYVNQWTFDRFDQRYEIALEIHWREARFDDDYFRLRGVLEVAVSGAAAQFRRTGGGRAARRRWKAAVSDLVLQLDPLKTARPDSLRRYVRRRRTTDA